MGDPFRRVQGWHHQGAGAGGHRKGYPALDKQGSAVDPRIRQDRRTAAHPRPGLQPDRVRPALCGGAGGSERPRYSALRQAFTAAIRDPELRAEAERIKVDIDAIGGDELQTAIAKSTRPRPISWKRPSRPWRRNSSSDKLEVTPEQHHEHRDQDPPRRRPAHPAHRRGNPRPRSAREARRRDHQGDLPSLARPHRHHLPRTRSCRRRI